MITKRFHLFFDSACQTLALDGSIQPSAYHALAVLSAIGVGNTRSVSNSLSSPTADGWSTEKIYHYRLH